MSTDYNPIDPTVATEGDISMQQQRSRHAERGQVLAIVAGGAIALILLMGLVLDGGLAFLNRRDGQNTSDVMALAGTKFVADTHRAKPQADPSITTTFEALRRTAMANDCAAGGAVPCTWQAWYVVGGPTGPVDSSKVTAGSAVPANALGVRVAVNRQPRTFVVGFVGIANWAVDTEATAIAEALRTAPAGQLLPIGAKDPTSAVPAQDPYQPGQVYDLTDGKDEPGGFGWLTWLGSPNATVLGDSICTPDNPEFTLPVDIDGSKGKTNAIQVRTCLDEWISSGQTVLIPIFDTVTKVNGDNVYHVIAVAAFVLTSREQPAVDNIRGYFVEIYPTNPIPGGVGSRPPNEDDTSFSLTLVR